MRSLESKPQSLLPSGPRLDVPRGFREGLPTLPVQPEVIDGDLEQVRFDPLARNNERIEALATVLIAMGRGIGLHQYRVGLELMIQRLGRAVLETPRARLMDGVMDFLAGSADWLREAWRRGQVSGGNSECR